MTFCLRWSLFKNYADVSQTQAPFSNIAYTRFFPVSNNRKISRKIEMDRQHRMIETSTNALSNGEIQDMHQPKVIRKQSVPFQLTKQYPQCVLLTGVTGF